MQKLKKDLFRVFGLHHNVLEVVDLFDIGPKASSLPKLHQKTRIGQSSTGERRTNLVVREEQLKLKSNKHSFS